MTFVRFHENATLYYPEINRLSPKLSLQCQVFISMLIQRNGCQLSKYTLHKVLKYSQVTRWQQTSHRPLKIKVTRQSTSHMRVHMGEQPYSCALRNKNLSHSSNLQLWSVAIFTSSKPLHDRMIRQSDQQHATNNDNMQRADRRGEQRYEL